MGEVGEEGKRRPGKAVLEMKVRSSRMANVFQIEGKIEKMS